MFRLHRAKRMMNQARLKMRPKFNPNIYQQLRRGLRMMQTIRKNRLQPNLQSKSLLLSLKIRKQKKRLLQQKSKSLKNRLRLKHAKTLPKRRLVLHRFVSHQKKPPLPKWKILERMLKVKNLKRLIKKI